MEGIFRNPESFRSSNFYFLFDNRNRGGGGTNIFRDFGNARYEVFHPRHVRN